MIYANLADMTLGIFLADMFFRGFGLANFADMAPSGLLADIVLRGFELDGKHSSYDMAKVIGDGKSCIFDSDLEAQ
eukprot:3787686-Ditylum_brightwellii.AAC.1